MSYDNTDGDKGYTGDDDYDKQNKRKILLGKKTDGKKGQKDKGYVMFDEDDSDESLVTSEDVKSPSKSKKAKGFKFSTKKKDKDKEKEKEEKKEVKREEKEREKEKKKEGKEHKKHKKDKKKGKQEVEQTTDTTKELDKAIFGVPLTIAVERNKCYDGIELPVMFRECIDYIEEHGLSCEGIYRISGVKSKIQLLKECYNKGLPVFLEEHEPNIVASLLKQFLRELPEPVLTTWLMPKFEEASILKSEKSKVERFHKLIHDLPKPNRLLLSWMIVHMTHVIERQKENKMTLQNVSIVLSPTMQISHRVLNVLFSHVKQLFKHTELKKYKPPLRPAHSKWSLELPDSPVQLEEELLKQEALLNNLHEQLQSGVTDQEKEEQLWEVQRVVTQLKRKIKMARKGEVKRKSDEVRKSRNSQDEELKLELKEIPIKQPAPQPPSQNSNEKAHAPQPPSEPTDEKSQAAQPPSELINEKAQTVQPPSESSNEKAEVKFENEAKQDTTDKNKGEKLEKKVKPEVQKEGKNETKHETISSQNIEEKIDNESKQEENKEPEKKSEKIEDMDKKELITEKPVVVTKEKDSIKATEENKLPEVKEQVHVSEESGPSPESSGDEFENQVEQILEQQKDIQAREFSEDSETGTIGEEVDLREITEEPSTESTVDADIPTDSIDAVHELKKETIGGDVITRVPEQVNTAEQDVAEFISVPDSDTVFVEEDEELIQLQEEDYRVRLEEEELIAIESELRTKIETEKNEIERLQQEITELQYLRQDSDLEEYSSSSDSSSDSEDEEDLQEILSDLLEKNESLEKKNADLCNKIHEERMICLAVKIQIRMLQQKQLESSANDLEKDLLW